MHRLYPRFVGGAGAVGLLVLRLVAGAAFVVHGWGKVQHEGQITMFHWMPAEAGVPGALQALAALAEFGGGILLILGLLTPVAAFFIACTMIVALAKVHSPHHDPFVNPGGHSFEPALGYLAVMVVFLLVGPGTLSLDALLFNRSAKATALPGPTPTGRAR
jgi:putative oxidoreductase